MDRQRREMYVANLIEAGGGRINARMAVMIARDIERFYINQFESGNLTLEEAHMVAGSLIPGSDATIGQLAEFAIECKVIWQYMPDRKINAIKELRAICQVGLKEAKDAVELGQDMIDKGYMPKSEREKVEIEAAEAIESIRATMTALNAGAESAGVTLGLATIGEPIHKATEGLGPIKSLCGLGGYNLAEHWNNVTCESCRDHLSCACEWEAVPPNVACPRHRGR